MEEPPLVLPVRVNSSWPAVHCGVLEVRFFLAVLSGFQYVAPCSRQLLHISCVPRGAMAEAVCEDEKQERGRVKGGSEGGGVGRRELIGGQGEGGKDKGGREEPGHVMG